MRHEDLPSQTRERLHQILLAHKRKQERVPEVGDCFFLEAPTLRPHCEQDHALVAAISRERGALVCAKISLEYWEASEHDYMLDADEWSAPYPALVEVWNSILFLPAGPTLIHAHIHPHPLELVRRLFLWHQGSQSPPKDFQGVGRAMPHDPRHPAWRFRAREAEVMERVRRHYHEGWDVKIVRLPLPRRPARIEPRMAAATQELAWRIERELEAQKDDIEILGPSEMPQGRLFLRRNEALPGYELLWYSPQASTPPAVQATPPLEPGRGGPTQGAQVVLGAWREEGLERQLLLEVRAEGLARDIAVRVPRKRK